MQTEVKIITPKLAAVYLECNTGNRKPKLAVIGHYAGILERGEWMLTHQGIAFNQSGNLMDGQHRLMAIVKSGIPAEMMITTGITDESFLAFDQGTPRSLADVTRIDRRVAEVLTTAFRIGQATTKKPTGQVILEINEKIGARVSSLILEHGTNVSVFSTVAFKLAATVQSFNKDDNGYAFDLFGKLVTSEIAGLPVLGDKLVKQKLKGMLRAGGGVVTKQLFFLAMVVFDRKNKRQTLTCTETDNELSLSKLQRLIK